METLQDGTQIWKEKVNVPNDNPNLTKASSHLTTWTNKQSCLSKSLLIELWHYQGPKLSANLNRDASLLSVFETIEKFK
jgi:outer membrane protein assembly factor BamB